MVRIAKMPTQAGKLRRRSADKSIAVLIQQYRVLSQGAYFTCPCIVTQMFISGTLPVTCEVLLLSVLISINDTSGNCAGVNGIILRLRRAIFAIVRDCFPF